MSHRVPLVRCAVIEGAIAETRSMSGTFMVLIRMRGVGGTFSELLGMMGTFTVGGALVVSG